MSDETRKFLEAHDDWMGEELTGALPISYVKYRISEPAAEHIRCLLEENEKLLKIIETCRYCRQEAKHGKQI